MELAVLWDLGQAKSKVRALNFRKANCQLFKELVSVTPGKLPSGRRSRAELAGLQGHFPSSTRAQDLQRQEIGQGRQKSDMAEVGPAGQNQGRTEMHRQWKQGEVSWEKYRETARLCRGGSRKAKAGAELGKGHTE